MNTVQKTQVELIARLANNAQVMCDTSTPEQTAARLGEIRAIALQLVREA